MILFLTSSPTGDLDGKYTCEGFDKRHGFADELRKVWREDARVLMVSAFPDNISANEEMRNFFYAAVIKTGLSCEKFDIWDARILTDPAAFGKENVQAYDVIILGGGHVPTQQKFFVQLGLRENLCGFDGIIIAISAGSMNCADIVYAQPEEAGEAINPDYQRFLRGLGLTGLNILPHYQMGKDSYVDGLRLYQDIVLPDSKGHKFLAIPDGSFVMEGVGKSRIGADDWMQPFEAKLFGEGYWISDGKITFKSSN